MPAIGTPQQLRCLDLNQKSINSRSSRLLTLRFFVFTKKILRELANTVYISESNRCLREFISAYYLYTNLEYMCTKK